MPGLIEVKDLPEEILVQMLENLDYNEMVSISRLEFHCIYFKYFFYFKSQQAVWQALPTNFALKEDDAEGGGVGWVSGD